MKWFLIEYYFHFPFGADIDQQSYLRPKGKCLCSEDDLESRPFHAFIDCESNKVLFHVLLDVDVGFYHI